MTRGQLQHKTNPWITDYFNIINWVVGTKSNNVINVALTCKDCRNQPIGQSVAFELYLAGTANGLTIPGTAPTSNTVIGTNGLLIPGGVGSWANMVWTAVTTSGGLIDINITQTGSPVNYWLVAISPDGSLIISPEISF